MGNGDEDKIRYRNDTDEKYDDIHEKYISEKHRAAKYKFKYEKLKQSIQNGGASNNMSRALPIGNYDGINVGDNRVNDPTAIHPDPNTDLANADNNGNDFSADLSNWIYQEGYRLNQVNGNGTGGGVVENGPVAYYSKIVEKYGKPTYLVNKRNGVAKWIKGETEKDISPHEIIMIKDEYVKHDSPRPHYDFMYSVIEVWIPPEKLVNIIKISGSISYDPLYHHLRARCSSFAANFATFKTAFEVLNDQDANYGANIDSKEAQEESNEEYVKRMVQENQNRYRTELATSSYPLQRI